MEKKLTKLIEQKAYVPYSIDGAQGAILLEDLINNFKIEDWFNEVSSAGGVVTSISADENVLILNTIDENGTPNQSVVELPIPDGALILPITSTDGVLSLNASDQNSFKGAVKAGRDIVFKFSNYLNGYATSLRYVVAENTEYTNRTNAQGDDVDDYVAFGKYTDKDGVEHKLQVQSYFDYVDSIWQATDTVAEAVKPAAHVIPMIYREDVNNPGYFRPHLKYPDYTIDDSLDPLLTAINNNEQIIIELTGYPFEPDKWEDASTGKAVIPMRYVTKRIYYDREYNSVTEISMRGSFYVGNTELELYFRVNNDILSSGSWVNIYADITPAEPYEEDQLSYGVEIRNGGYIYRIGNFELHRSLPIQKKILQKQLGDSGIIDDYDSPRQEMIEIPEFYIKYYKDDYSKEVRISEYPLPGYKRVPKFYVGRYEASLKRSENKLCSVANTDPDYRGGNNNADWDGTYRSLLGMPITGLTRAELRTAARNRNGGNDTRWGIMTLEQRQILTWLYVIEYANLNIQDSWNPSFDSQFHRQGGLDTGVTDIPDATWGDYNEVNPIVPCDSTQSLYGGTGIVEFTSVNDDATIVINANVPSWRGIENFFGHIRECLDGVNIKVKDGKAEVYVCNDPTKFNDTNVEGYTKVGETLTGEGFANDIVFGESGCIIPKSVGGSSSSGYYDYVFGANTDNTEEIRTPFVGGCAWDNEFAGLFSFSLAFGVTSIPDWYKGITGARLCFTPNENNEQ